MTKFIPSYFYAERRNNHATPLKLMAGTSPEILQQYRDMSGDESDDIDLRDVTQWYLTEGWEWTTGE